MILRFPFLQDPTLSLQDRWPVRFRCHHGRILYMAHQRVSALLPVLHYPRPDEVDSTYSRLLRVLDYVSGMTDRYAVNLYQKLKGISL